MIHRRLQLGQMRYHRNDKDRVDHVTLLLPSTGDLMPADEAFEELTRGLQGQLASKIAAIDAPPPPAASAASASSTSVGSSAGKRASDAPVQESKVSRPVQVGVACFVFLCDRVPVPLICVCFLSALSLTVVSFVLVWRAN